MYIFLLPTFTDIKKGGQLPTFDNIFRRLLLSKELVYHLFPLLQLHSML